MTRSEMRTAVDTLLSSVLFVATFDPPMGTLNALLNAASLTALGSPDLVGELTAWPAAVDNLVEDEVEGRELGNRTLLPYLRRHGVRTIDLIFGAGDYPWTPSHTEAYVPLEDPEFESIIGDRWFNAEFALASSRQVRERLNRILELIDRELSSGG